MITHKIQDENINLCEIPEEMLPFATKAKELVSLRSIYEAAIKEVSTKLEILDNEFQVNHDYNPIHHIESRVKSIQSTFEKLIRLGLDADINSIEKIEDMAGIRVICKYRSDVYKMASLLIKQNDIELVTEKDYIKNPKQSGYRSLHIVITVPVYLSNRVEKVPVEIQIRTVMMDTWASLEHELKYKNGGTHLSVEDCRRLEECAEEMHNIDIMLEKMHIAYLD